MNLQNPIVKPSGPQSLFALRKAGVTASSGQKSVVTKPETAIVASVPVTQLIKNHQELGLMSNPSVLMALQKKQTNSLGKWHAPWKLHRVIQGHQGWVKTLDIDPSNEWFATGSNDRMIKIWDLATGVLRLSLTGHTHNVRAVRIHPKFKYLFSAGEDNMVKCWDLEQNKVIRHYHGHLSGVYCMDVHPEDGYLFTGARDASIRMWDIRTKECVHVFGGHTHTVQCVKSNAAVMPELISGSADATVRLWDIRTGRTRAYKTLTHHKKGIRAITSIEDKYFSTAAADQVKIWDPQSEFECNLGHLSDNDKKVDKIVNCTDYESEGIFVTGSDDGTLSFYDWESKKQFQQIQTPPQPGSLEAENGIFALKFDFSGNRLITAECDKTIKMYRRDDSAINPNE